MLKKDDLYFQASLGYLERPCPEKRKQNRKKKITKHLLFLI
jgi:hypothetical protein